MSRLQAVLRRSPELVPGLIAVGVFVALAADDGGYAATAWYPAALFSLGLLAVCVLALGRHGRLQLGGGLRLAVVMLAGFTAWSFASMLWAEVPADAWDGANRTLLYLLVFALFAALPWRASTAGVVIAAYATAIAVLALVTLADLAGSADPELGMIASRLAEPTGYHNATAALFLAAFFPALLLASRREVPWWARGVLLAAAAVLLQVALIPQSRGSAVAFPLVAIAFLALAPGRARLLAFAAPVGLATLLASPPLLDVYSTARDDGDVIAAFDDAFRAVAISAFALLLLGWAAALADRAVRPAERVGRHASRAVGALAALAAVVGLVVALNATGNPADWLDERWQDFKSGDAGEAEEDTRFTGSLGSNRYDFWRVALDEFGDEPLAGMGMDQFAVAYVRERESAEEPFNPHSVGIKIVSQTGLIGALLFLGFLVAAAAGGLRARFGGGDTLSSAVAIAGLIAFAYWLVHGFGDWFWELPGLAAPAFAGLAIAAALARREDVQSSSSPGPVVLAGGAVLALVAAASLAIPWAAARDVAVAAENWPADPEAAFERLERARDLNPLTDTPDSFAGTIAVRIGEPRRAEAAFAAAVERNDSSWYSHAMLGALQATRGERAEALRNLRDARELNPSDPLNGRAIERARAGRPLEAAAIDRELQQRLCLRLGRTSATPDCE